MTDYRLPDGVPADNSRKPQTRPSFSGPNTATPHFSGGDDARAGVETQTRESLTFSSAYDGSAGGDAPKASGGDMNGLPQKIVGVVIVLLLGLVALMVIAASGDRTQSCADRPTWNQFDCRTN